MAKPKPNVRPEEVAWSVHFFSRLNDGGTWAVPRSGLIFQKRGRTFRLITAMPFMPEMAEAAKGGASVPGTAKELRQWQLEDFEQIAARFRAGGIEVFDDALNVD